MFSAIISCRRGLFARLFAIGLSLSCSPIFPEMPCDYVCPYPAQQEISGSIVTLRSLSLDYCPDYYKMFSPIVRKNLEFPDEYTFNDCTRLVEFYYSLTCLGLSLNYCIFDNMDDCLIGDLYILNQGHWAAKSHGQFGWWVNENYWGRGRAQEALALITLDYFEKNPEELNVNAYVALWNKRSYIALIKGGFKDTGVIYDADPAHPYIILQLDRHYVMPDDTNIMNN